jgi:diaminohydroxyphosphoribosylaminopyrimidine deaminase / 5-amino-6-(5-phosphoribosylamino)uracil reductase
MHHFFLRRTLELAERRRGFCSPNPSVGAVLVRDGKILSEGLHLAAGSPHAEVAALKDVPQEVAEKSTLYVSLEPCCHFGRTPPCTELILAKRIPEVVYAYADPNPLVAGKGAERLRESGVRVTQVPLVEVETFYESYRYWTLNKRPFVTAKLALSLDGKTAGAGGEPLALTGPEANRFTHERRLRSDCILTTASTVLADNPRLNARLYGVETPKPIVVLDRLGRTPLNSRVFQSAANVLIYTDSATPLDRKQSLEALGAEVRSLDTVMGKLPLPQILSELGAKGYHDVWVEGGAALFTAFLRERLAQRAYLYLAPVTVGAEGMDAFGMSWEGILSDAKVTWTPQGRDVVAEVVW